MQQFDKILQDRQAHEEATVNVAVSLFGSKLKELLEAEMYEIVLLHVALKDIVEKHKDAPKDTIVPVEYYKGLHSSIDRRYRVLEMLKPDIDKLGPLDFERVCPIVLTHLDALLALIGMEDNMKIQYIRNVQEGLDEYIKAYKRYTPQEQ